MASSVVVVTIGRRSVASTIRWTALASQVSKALAAAAIRFEIYVSQSLPRRPRDAPAIGKRVITTKGAHDWKICVMIEF